MSRKTLYIYEELSEEERMEWLTARQVIGYDAVRFPSNKAFKELDESDEVERRYMAVHTDEYERWVKNNEGEKFLSSPYYVEVFYKKSDVKAFIKKYPKFSYLGDLEKLEWPRDGEENLRTYLNDMRSIKNEGFMFPVVFYGEKHIGIHDNDKGNQFRNYYSLFFLHSYITHSFIAYYGLSHHLLDLLVYFHVLKYFERATIFNHFRGTTFFRNKDGDIGGLGGRSRTFAYLEKNGYVERVDYSERSMYRGSKKYTRRKLYTVTMKTEKIVNTYMNWLMYKEKMPFQGDGYNTKRLTRIDLKGRSGGENYLKQHPAYMFYEYVYDYINYKSDVELFSGDMLEFMQRAESREFYFNPILMKVSEERYLSSDGKNSNSSYIKSLIEARRWGIKT